MEKGENLHPSVKEFKEFVRQHPLMMREVSKKQKTLQELYEEWSVLGPDHEQWEQYKIKDSEQDIKSNKAADDASETDSGKESKNSGLNETLGQLFGVLKRMNVEDLQAHLTQFSSVLANVQQVMQSFQRPSEEQQQNQQQPEYDPFSFRRD